jgi:hypothetical protein
LRRAATGAVLRPHLDHLHHAFVFMFDYVAVKNKAPNDFWVGKWKEQFCRTWLSVLHGWNAKRVAQTVKLSRNAIDFGDQKSGLMDVEVMILRVLV